MSEIWGLWGTIVQILCNNRCADLGYSYKELALDPLDLDPSKKVSKQPNTKLGFANQHSRLDKFLPFFNTLNRISIST